MNCTQRLLMRTALVLLIGAAVAHAQSPTSQPAQAFYPTPRAAADALFEACKNNDTAALVKVLGPRFAEHSSSVDDTEEREHRGEVYEWSQQRLEIEPEGDAKATIIIGRRRWPVPIPLLKEAAGWRFDTEAGIQEIQARRIGSNELAVIDVCQEYVRFQIEYAAVDRDGDEVREFAQQFVSTPGKQDGLYWEWDPNSGERPSPLETLLPDYFGDVSKAKPGSPYMGYYFKILKGQGANPPGGKYDYVINGNMIAGFALVAWPADYRQSGVMTFVISHQGKLFEKDLGPDTAKIAGAMTEYDPDKTWELFQP